MNECKICGKECKGKTCSGAHRAEFSRRTRTAKVGAQMQAHAKAHEVGQTAQTTQKQDEQEAAQSTKSDGPGQIHPAEQGMIDMGFTPCVDQPDISLLPAGVSKPTGQRTIETANMTSQYLRTRMSWIASPEYAEEIHRLLTQTIEELDIKGQFVPAWRLRQESAQAQPVDDRSTEVTVLYTAKQGVGAGSRFEGDNSNYTVITTKAILIMDIGEPE